MEVLSEVKILSKIRNERIFGQSWAFVLWKSENPVESRTWRRTALLHVEEALLEGHVQGADGALLLAVLLQVVDGAPVTDAVRRGARVVVVVAVDAAQPLQVADDVHGVLVQQRVLGQVLHLRRN